MTTGSDQATLETTLYSLELMYDLQSAGS